jgi:hypothetical protein
MALFNVAFFVTTGLESKTIIVDKKGRIGILNRTSAP